MYSIGIIGSGFYVPSKVLHNKDISKTLNTSDEWIYEKTGIRERHIADPAEATSDLAIYAAQDALRRSGIKSDQIDLIVLATSSPDMIQPATASIVQGKIGAYNSAAFDIGAVCAGFVYAISVAQSMMMTNRQYKKALVIGAETYSRLLDWSDRTTCVFFGDGAGAVVLGAVEEDLGIKDFFLKNDGRGATVIKFLGGGSRYPSTSETIEKNFHKFEMQGKLVWDFATRVMPEAVTKVAERAGWNIKDINYIIPHQANINIIKKSMNTLELPLERAYVNIEKYGNTSGASIPLALAEADSLGKFKKGDNIVLVGFGGGLSYGAVSLKWAI